MTLEIKKDDLGNVWASGDNQRAALQKRRDYYNGEQKILSKVGPDGSDQRADLRPYNKRVANWIQILVDRHTGFVTSSPFAITIGEDAEPDQVKAAEQYNELRLTQDLSAIDARQYQRALLTGYGVEVHTFSAGDGVVGITDYDAEEWVFLTDENGADVAAIRRMELSVGDVYQEEILEDKLTLWWVYNDKETVHYVQRGDQGEITKDTDGSATHEYKDLPVRRWGITPDHRPLISDAIISIQDAFNETLSVHLDDHESDVAALLAMIGFDPTELLNTLDAQGNDTGKTAILRMKEAGAIGMPDKDSDAKFLTRNLPFGKTEFTLRVLRRLIYSMGSAPDLEEIVGTTGGTSGIALRLQFQQMIERVGEFSRYVELSIRDRVRFLNKAWGPLTGMETLERYAVDVSYEIPANSVERWSNIRALEHLLSRVDQARLIPDIDDPEGAIDRKEAEEAEKGVVAGAAEGEAAQTPGAPDPAQAQAAAAAALAQANPDREELIAAGEIALRENLEASLAALGIDLTPDVLRALIDDLILALRSLGVG